MDLLLVGMSVLDILVGAELFFNIYFFIVPLSILIILKGLYSLVFSINPFNPIFFVLSVLDALSGMFLIFSLDFGISYFLGISLLLKGIYSLIFSF